LAERWAAERSRDLPVNSFDLVTEIGVVGSNEKVTERVSWCCFVVSLLGPAGSRLSEVQGRGDGLAPLLIGTEEPSGPLEGFSFADQGGEARS
jgi:hypothetical protein